jgi:hypothetical protein
MPLLATMVTTACAGSYEPLAERPQGYATKMEAADAHSQSADAHRQLAVVHDEQDPAHPTSYQCGDVALADQTTSGGQRVMESVPCWNIDEESAAHQRFLADREQAIADDERRSATQLVEAELAACRGLSARELEHSPFAHRREIQQVLPHREAGVLRGVRIVWKPVLGLSARWMRASIDCHRARFERMGEPSMYLPDDPTLVARSTVTVSDRGGHVEVLVETDDEVSSHVALERARDLVRQRTALAD